MAIYIILLLFISSCVSFDDEFPFDNNIVELEYLRDQDEENKLEVQRKTRLQEENDLKESLRDSITEEVRAELFKEIDSRTKGVVVVKGEGSNENSLTEYKDQEPEFYPTLKAVGYASISLQKGKNKSEKLLKAIKSSKLDAYRELVEQLHGRDVSSSSLIENGLEENSSVETMTTGLIRGAEIVKVYSENDLYITELVLDLKKAKELYILSTQPRVVDRIIQY